MVMNSPATFRAGQTTLTFTRGTSSLTGGCLAGLAGGCSWTVVGLWLTIGAFVGHAGWDEGMTEMKR